MMLGLAMLFHFLMQPTADEWLTQEKQWRIDREERLKSDDGWLNVAGFFWLDEGTHSFGTAEDVDIRLPLWSTVAHAGTLAVKHQEVVFSFARAQRGKLGETWVREGSLTLSGDTNVLAHHHLRFLLIERGGRLALRVRDLQSRALLDFPGLSFFAPDPAYLIQARLERFSEPKQVFVPTVIGTEERYWAPGLLHFDVQGRAVTLLPLTEEPQDKSLFLNFMDETSGITSYPAGRFLMAELLEDETVWLNFNRAISPPCAFTSFATCPLPPEENRLPLAIEAGEKWSGTHP